MQRPLSLLDSFQNGPDCARLQVWLVLTYRWAYDGVSLLLWFPFLCWLMSLSTFSCACCPFWTAFLEGLFRYFDLFFIALGYLMPPSHLLICKSYLYILDMRPSARLWQTSSFLTACLLTQWFSQWCLEKQYFRILVTPDLLAFAFCFMVSFCYHIMTFLPCSRTWRVFLCYYLEVLLLWHLSLWLIQNIFFNVVWGVGGRYSLFPCWYWITSSPFCRNTIFSSQWSYDTFIKS